MQGEPPLFSTPLLRIPTAPWRQNTKGQEAFRHTIPYWLHQTFYDRLGRALLDSVASTIHINGALPSHYMDLQVDRKGSPPPLPAFTPVATEERPHGDVIRDYEAHDLAVWTTAQPAGQPFGPTAGGFAPGGPGSVGAVAGGSLGGGVRLRRKSAVVRSPPSSPAGRGGAHADAEAVSSVPLSPPALDDRDHAAYRAVSPRRRAPSQSEGAEEGLLSRSGSALQVLNRRPSEKRGPAVGRLHGLGISPERYARALSAPEDRMPEVLVAPEDIQLGTSPPAASSSSFARRRHLANNADWLSTSLGRSAPGLSASLTRGEGSGSLLGSSVGLPARIAPVIGFAGSPGRQSRAGSVALGVDAAEAARTGPEVNPFNFAGQSDWTEDQRRWAHAFPSA